MLHKAKVDLVVEATGRYHRPVHISLDDAGFRVAVVSPLQARRFAQALGQLAKTDPIDAAMLARLGQAMDPDATPPRSGAHVRLGDLARARAQLVKTKTALSNSIKEYETPETVAAFKQLVNDTNREISRLGAAIRVVIVDDPEHARRDRIDTRHRPCHRRRALCRDARARHARPPPGRFPGECRSVPGRQRKEGRKAILQGARAVPRNLLFMAEMTASMYNAEMKQLYERLTEEGKPHKVAVVAVMCKLVILANVRVRDDREGVPSAPAPVAA